MFSQNEKKISSGPHNFQSIIHCVSCAMKKYSRLSNLFDYCINYVNFRKRLQHETLAIEVDMKHGLFHEQLNLDKCKIYVW